MKIKIKKYTLKHEIEILKNMKIKLKNWKQNHEIKN